ncbi:MAG: hypothetical protein M1305_05250 [Candidatus Marsarchaeota archaeon]|nr:hypothetical protein [Candidatus Marsarchaeota archaeon]
MDKKSLILEIVKDLRLVGSWAGRTHIQKTAYLLKELCRVDVGYDFTLYKHGPYSFQLDADIEDLRILGGLDYEIVRSEYGPRYKEGAAAHAFRQQADLCTLEAIQEMADFVRDKDVKDLECLSTLVWCGGASSADIPKVTECVLSLKPHLSEPVVTQAWSQLNCFVKRAKNCQVAGRA